MLTILPPYEYLYDFSSRQQPFRSIRSIFWELSLVHCKIWGVTQQRVYQYKFSVLLFGPQVLVFVPVLVGDVLVVVGHYFLHVKVKDNM